MPELFHEKNLSGAPLSVRLLGLPTNNKLGWKSLPGTNTLAYYEKAQLTAGKSFIILTTGRLFFIFRLTFTIIIY